MPKFTFSSLILTAFLIFNCAPKPRILLEERTPQSVLKCAVENQVKFETFACIVNLKLKGKKAKFSSTIEFFYKSPDLFSFYPQSFWGTDIFKAKGENDSLTIYFPNDNEFYKGNFSDFEKSELWSLKIDLRTLLKIITGESVLSERDLLYVRQEKDKFIYKFEDERWTKEYWIDSKKCLLVKSMWNDKERGGAYTMGYKDFSSRQNVRLANVIEINSTTKESARIKFIERKFNLLIPEKKFQLEIPLHAKRITFEPNM
jgi:hypothetical protein